MSRSASASVLRRGLAPGGTLAGKAGGLARAGTPTRYAGGGSFGGGSFGGGSFGGGSFGGGSFGGGGDEDSSRIVGGDDDGGSEHALDQSGRMMLNRRPFPGRSSTAGGPGRSLRLDAKGYTQPPPGTSAAKLRYISLGQDLLVPLAASEVDTATIRVAKPRSAQADRRHEEFLSSQPKSVLTRDEKGSAEWRTREVRVADNLRRHVQIIRAENLPRDNKAALLLKRQQYKPPR
jgi:hypothetical protein